MSIDIPRRLRLGALDGVWQWPVALTSSDADAVVAALGDTPGWHTVLLDTATITAADEPSAKEQFLQACSDAFALPEWFGMNWDALDECLADLDVGESEGILVLWSGWQPLAAGAPSVFAEALDVLGESAHRWVADGVPGAVVLLGPGDVDGLPEL